MRRWLRISVDQLRPSKATAPPPLPDCSLFGSFQSLGDNCEFGLVQSFFGADQLGLLKFGHMSFANLLRALDERFSAFFQPDLAIHLRVEGPDTGVQEFFGMVEAYDLLCHTGRRPPAELDDVITSQRRRLAFLARTFIEDLQDAEKIFVYRTEESVTRGDIEALHGRLRSYGPVTLLWVTGQDSARSPGDVEWIGEGLLRGTITRLAPYANANDYDSESWRQLCLRALVCHEDRRRTPGLDAIRRRAL